MTTTTHQQAMINHFVSNQRFIQTELEISTTEYFSEIMELGCLFLENQYPINDPDYTKLHNFHRNNRAFWQFFQLEVKNFESKLIEKQGGELTRILWRREVENFCFSTKLQIAFNNQYIRLL